MALSTMLNQRRGGQPGYMPPSTNPQQVDKGTLGFLLISKGGVLFQMDSFHIQNISAVHWQTAMQEQILAPVVVLVVMPPLRMHQSLIYDYLGKNISQNVTM